MSKRALRTIERINAHWHAHADDPTLFASELDEVADRLETAPGIGRTHPAKSRPALRRLLLPKSKCHVYYEVDEARQTVTIVELWDGRRGRPPKL
jgi:plasmid stabilization system protein ParE